VQSICVLRLSAIGDVCNAIAVVQAIQRHYPQAAMTWVVGKVEAELLKGLPGVRLVVFDKRKGWKAYWSLWQALRGQRFDALLHMQVAFRANLASLCIRARRKIGFDWRTAKELHALFMRERVAPVEGMHVAEAFLHFASAIGVQDGKPVWSIPVLFEHQQWINQLVISSRSSHHLLLCPSASATERNWLPDRYAAVIDHACKLGFDVWICGGPSVADFRMSEEIIGFCQVYRKRILNLTGQTSLQQLIALVHQATIVMSPDSGPAHIAAAFSKPVIGLYGHSNPARTGPYGSPYVVEVYHQHLLAQTGKTAAEVKWGTRVKGQHVMESISVDVVTQMFDRVIQDLGLSRTDSNGKDGP
jgi:heptosyltransferase I